MRYLSLDQSTTSTGYAIFDGEELIEHGIKPLKGPDQLYRIFTCVEWILDLVADQEIQMVGLEDVQDQSNHDTFKLLAKLLGAIEYGFIREDVGYRIYKASEWRKGAGIKGRARKEQKQNAINRVKELYGIEVPEDEAEAICIGIHLVKDQYKPGF